MSLPAAWMQRLYAWYLEVEPDALGVVETFSGVSILAAADRAVDYICSPCLAQLDSLFAALEGGPPADVPALRAYVGLAAV